MSSSLPFVELVIQRGSGDCGIAALAMLVGKPYEDVFAAAITRSRRSPHHNGMYTRELIGAAKRLGLSLSMRRSWDLETSCGLLTVERTEKKPGEFVQHLVLLKFGLIFDSDGRVYEPDFYFSSQGFRPVSILTEGTDGE